jgi:hypothetical protein
MLRRRGRRRGDCQRGLAFFEIMAAALRAARIPRLGACQSRLAFFQLAAASFRASGSPRLACAASRRVAHGGFGIPARTSALASRVVCFRLVSGRASQGRGLSGLVASGMSVVAAIY